MTRPPGMTLIEVVAALAISSMLLVAIGSAVVMASHALPQADSPTVAAIDGGALFERLASELETAQFMVERGPNAIGFTVPDRDGDGKSETVRYAWSGAEGDPLVRQFNGGPQVELLDGVRQFHLAYEVASVTETFRGQGVEDDHDVLLATFGNWGGYTEHAVKEDDWVGQYFLPDRARVGMRWRPTRVRIRARQASLPGFVRLGLHVADPGLEPIGSELDGQQLSYMQLVPWLHIWRDMVVDDVVGLPPDQGVCLVISHVQGSTGAYINYDDNDGPGLLLTDDAGADWVYQGGKSLACELYGRVTMTGAAQTVSRHYLKGVALALRSGRSDSKSLQTRITTLNHPELLSGLWSLDFESAPPGEEVNGDGQPDWALLGGGSFHGSTLAGGVWRPDQVIRTYPDHAFDTTTTIELRARATTTGGSGAVLAVNADWDGGSAVPLVLSITLEPDGRQMLRLLVEQVDGTQKPLIILPGLPTTMVDVRLLIEPDSRSVNLRVNGVDRGSVGYVPRALNGQPQAVMLFALDADAEFDDVRVRVGGQP